jgi:choline dehydrogenase-like flavoprotein
VIVDGTAQQRPLEEAFDHVVVGSGAAGATAALVLAESGSSVAVVEEGPVVRTEEFGDRAYPALGALYRDMGAQIARGRGGAGIPVFQGRCLGGTTVVNSAIVWRLPEDVWAGWRDDFGLGDALPLEDLERHFDRIERDLSVAPTPEEVWGGNNRLMAAAGAVLGVRTSPMRRAVVGCRGSSRCQTGCPHGAKQSMALTYLPRAESHGAVLFVNARADRVAMAGDRAEAVTGRFTGGAPFTLRARTGVVVAASATQTPGLLRRSGVRSAHLGAHFQGHPGTSVIGLFDQPVGMWRGATQGFESDQHRVGGRFKVESVALRPELLIASLPGVGRRWLDAIGRAWHMAMWAVDLRAHAEGRIGEGRGGGARIRFEPEPRDVDNLRAALAFIAEMLFAAGATAVMPLVHGLPDVIERPGDVRLLREGPRDPRAYSMALTHLFGTARMSLRPGDGVVGPDFAVHGTRNLYAVDSSVFPTNTGVNPQLSIMGLAMLAATRMREHWDG